MSNIEKNQEMILATGERLKQTSRNICFDIGDFLLRNPEYDTYDDTWDYALVAEYKKIAKMFPSKLRGLSWTSYRILSKIKDEIEREAICKYALKNKLKSKDVKFLIDNNGNL